MAWHSAPRRAARPAGSRRRPAGDRLSGLLCAVTPFARGSAHGSECAVRGPRL